MRRLRLLFSLMIASLSGIATLAYAQYAASPDHPMFRKTTGILVFPGIVVGIFFGGLIPGYVFYTAAVANVFLYFCLTWIAFTFVYRLSIESRTFRMK